MVSTTTFDAKFPLLTIRFTINVFSVCGFIFIFTKCMDKDIYFSLHRVSGGSAFVAFVSKALAENLVQLRKPRQERFQFGVNSCSLAV